MNVQNLFNQFVGTGASQVSSSRNRLSGMAGGAAAGGVMALLVGNKKARKFAGKAATVGGAAVVGGLAFAALKNWQQSKSGAPQAQQQLSSSPDGKTANAGFTPEFEMLLVKTMISAANADGHIDEAEQSRIFSTLDELGLGESTQIVVMDLIRYPESPEILARGLNDLEQKSEVYLMACFAIDVDNQQERTFLERLSRALDLPVDLCQQLEQQANELALQAA